MPRIWSLFALVFLLLGVQTAAARSSYGELSVVRTSVDASGFDVTPYMSTLKLGSYLSQQFAIELEYGSGFEDDESNNVNVEIDKHTGIYLRYVGDSSYNGVFFYLIAGSVKTELIFDGQGGTVTDEVKDIAYGIGAEERSSTVQNLVYSLEYIRYADKDEGEISGIKLGFRFSY